MTVMAMGRTWHIYCHTAPNGKRYIGQTRIAPEKRWSNGNGYASQQLFKRAIDKYGWDSFSHTVLCSVSSQDYADFLEQWFIEKYDTCDRKHGYNIAKGGQGVTGVTWDEERKRKRSADIKGSGNPMFGRKHSEEARRKMSENRKGAENITPEMREFRTNVLIKSNKRRSKAVRQLDMDGNLIATYSGMGELESAKGYSHSSVWKACHGHSDQAYGFRWEFEDEELRNKADKRRAERSAKINHVIQCDLSGNELAVYNSFTEAARKTGLCRDRIGDCCHGGFEEYGGYAWKLERPEQKVVDDVAVIQRDKEGKEVAQYDSLSEASEHTGVARYLIRNCCRGASKTAKGFIFEFRDNARKEKKSLGKVAVIQLDLNDNEVARYKSMTEAMHQTGNDRHRIAECCQGERESYRGFKWRYQSDQEVEQPKKRAFLLAEGGNDAV